MSLQRVTGMMMSKSFTCRSLLDESPKMFRPDDHFPYEKVIFQVIPKVTVHDFHYGIRMYFTGFINLQQQFYCYKSKESRYEKKKISFVKSASRKSFV